MASRFWDSASKAMFGSGSSGNNDSSSSWRSVGVGGGGGVSSSSSTSPSLGTTTTASLNDPRQTKPSYFDFSPYFDSSTYWNYASDSMNYASETAYLSLASMLSPFYAAGGDLFGSSNQASLPSSNNGLYDTPIKRSSFLLRMADRRYSPGKSNRRDGGGSYSSPSTPSSATTMLSPSSPGISWRTLTRNPYNVVRGRQPINHKRQSMSAVRSFLALVPVEEEDETLQDCLETGDYLGHDSALLVSSSPPPASAGQHVRVSSLGDNSATQSSSSHHHYRNAATSKDETASQVAEGTLRALRDLALEEALELNTALRFWSHRWERPLLSWLEAGPLVWTSGVGYRHRLVGERVAQLQAVLARRCAAIGELQEHLLRAGWQQGVAQWGVLDQFQTVSGVDGSIKTHPQEANHLPPLEKVDHNRMSIMTPRNIPNKQTTLSPSPSVASQVTPLSSSSQQQQQQQPSAGAADSDSTVRGPLRRASSHVGGGSALDLAPTAAHVLVRKGDGAGIYTDHPAFVAEWAVEAIALVRRHLNRASNGMVELPYESSWLVEETDQQGSTRALPVWATQIKPKAPSSVDEEEETAKIEEEEPPYLKVTDLNLMMTEVSELLNVMEDIMTLQRQRRLDRMRAPGWFRRNWFLVATFGPAAVWLLYTRRPRSMLSSAVTHVRQFIKERLTGPIMAIVDEVWKGRGNFSDAKARKDAADALKQMIKNWLDETYPQMEEQHRVAMSEAMDMSLIEQAKTESMKSFFRLNEVIQMSFIEMQYMKREMMDALAGMDEVMSANDINMNLAAITPMLVFIYANLRLFRHLYHAVLRLGRSREETYADFRTILIDIERLLVMRDSPPDIYRKSGALSTETGCCLLSPDDLGMLMLLIHELRTILMRERRRFTRDEIRGLSEDLAELAGERGAVSVRQQLQILTRMSRTYSFLKVLSTGTIFRH